MKTNQKLKAEVNQLKAFLKVVHLSKKSIDLTKELEIIQKQQQQTDPKTKQTSATNLADNKSKIAQSPQQQVYKKPITSLIVKSKSEYLCKFQPLLSQMLKTKTSLGEFDLLNLTKLVLNKCELKTIHSAVFQLKQLQHLDLSENKFSQIDEFKFDRLVDLNLAQNEIKHIGDNCSLPKLSNLDLSSNKLDYLSKKFFTIFRKVTKLRLNANNIKAFHSDFGYQMANLIHLFAANNQLKQLPFSVTSLRLETLELNDNPLESELLQIMGNKSGTFPTLVELSARKVVDKRHSISIFHLDKLILLSFN